MLQPRSVDELREVRHTLELYRQNYSVQVAVLLITADLVSQSLSIPGSSCINLLMGSMCAIRLQRVSCHSPLVVRTSLSRVWTSPDGLAFDMRTAAAFCRYSFPVAFAVIAMTSTVGASLNYFLSKLFLKDIVIGLFAKVSAT